MLCRWSRKPCHFYGCSEEYHLDRREDCQFLIHERSPMNPEKMAEFEALARPLIKFLCENTSLFDPHTTIIVTPTGAEILQGTACTGQILDYVRD